MITMLKEWRYFLLALGFFTRIPVPNFPDFKASDLNHSSKYFPLIGMIVGAVGAASFYLSALILSQNIALLISMAATIYCTGAFHEDGLADSADGFGGGWHTEQVLTIMQDSRLGTYGAVALFLMLFAKFTLLNTLPIGLILFALICAHALSRLSAVWVMATLNYVKFSGKAKPLATHISGRDLLIANVLGLLPLTIYAYLFFSQGAFLLTIKMLVCIFGTMLIGYIWWYCKLVKRLNGYTGDCLGAMQQITELAFYAGLVLWNFNT